MDITLTTVINTLSGFRFYKTTVVAKFFSFFSSVYFPNCTLHMTIYEVSSASMQAVQYYILQLSCSTVLQNSSMYCNTAYYYSEWT